MRIDPTGDVGQFPLARPTQATDAPNSSFVDVLGRAVQQVNAKQLHAENIIEQVASGEEIPSAVVASAVVQSDLAFRTMIQVRNKLVEAFNELRQLQV
ncbi:flagellar hook-basal body protein FliE [Planctomycetes bacterium Pan216]|uniref:Flagellar hook-basal body complex protein FliE n=1 Tax=Kolteria novifilia TaxID=2527975 RepID=A0A518B538_9BACT|nr:flagellar hook-basal body protein FliE [Planctomycetes bacterium Pan216]